MTDHETTVTVARPLATLDDIANKMERAISLLVSTTHDIGDLATDAESPTKVDLVPRRLYQETMLLTIVREQLEQADRMLQAAHQALLDQGVRNKVAS